MQSLMRALIFGFIGLLVAGTGYLLVRNGAFLHVEMRFEDRGPVFLLQKARTGPYHKIAPELDEIQAAVIAAGLPCPRTFGEYLDNPSVVEAGRLRSNIGCVLPEAPAAAPEGLTLRTLPARKYLTAVFHGSPALGPYKVYGRSQNEIQKSGMTSDGPPIEIYTVQPDDGLETVYLFPVR